MMDGKRSGEEREVRLLEVVTIPLSRKKVVKLKGVKRKEKASDVQND